MGSRPKGLCHFSSLSEPTNVTSPAWELGGNARSVGPKTLLESPAFRWKPRQLDPVDRFLSSYRKPRCSSSSKWTAASYSAGCEMDSTRALKFRPPSIALLLNCTPLPNPAQFWFLGSDLGPPHESGSQPRIPSAAHRRGRPKNAPALEPEDRCPIHRERLREAPTAAGLLHRKRGQEQFPILDAPGPYAQKSVKDSTT